ncbi:MAG: Holliday junction branch migration protein RuvA [Clostridia bacterium]|nr:Holliday junction branch migration protein RuvA [Clostridia bacterium]
MIGYIKGEIAELGADSALIITDSGVGFEVLISGTARMQLEGKKEGALYTSMQVREDGVTLYGFSSQEEKKMFLQLTSVSGVGPKLGIAVLSTLTVADVAMAIATSDIKKLATVKGMGKKTAERIIVDLREKMGSAEIPASDGTVIMPPADGDEDAIVALMTLGFTRAECSKAISKAKAQGAKSVEDILYFALRSM